MWQMFQPMYTTIAGLNLFDWAWLLVFFGAALMLYGLSLLLFGDYYTSYVFSG